MRSLAVVIACISVSTVLGSVHAFSVFVPDWEIRTGHSRAAISFVYSLTLISLTFAVLIGHHLFRRWPAYLIFSAVGAGSFIGLTISALSNNIYWIYLSYGCVFGFANGLGYGYTLQLAGQTANNRRALSMSLVTAFYAVGAALASQLFHQRIQTTGIESTLKLAGIGIFFVCAAAAAISFLTRVSLRLEKPAIESQRDSSKQLQFILWLLYGSSVTAGLMVIGHALPIFTSRHPEVLNAATAPVVVAIGNIVGGLSVGIATVKAGNRTLLLVFSLLSLVGLLLVWQTYSMQVVTTLVGLLLVGFSYGAIIAVFPIVVADAFGELTAPRIYGRVFTAWGLAGLVAPTLSGYIYDQSGSYELSIGLALLVCIFSLFVLLKHLDLNTPAYSG